MSSSVLDYMLLVCAYTRANLKAQLEYRGAFFSQAGAMFINDGAWLLFWAFFFTRFPVLQGWGLTDVLSLWAMVAAGFGSPTRSWAMRCSLPRSSCRATW